MLRQLGESRSLGYRPEIRPCECCLQNARTMLGVQWGFWTHAKYPHWQHLHHSMSVWPFQRLLVDRSRVSRREDTAFYSGYCWLVRKEIVVKDTRKGVRAIVSARRGGTTACCFMWITCDLQTFIYRASRFYYLLHSEYYDLLQTPLCFIVKLSRACALMS
jgi:hypothetical protein